MATRGRHQKLLFAAGFWALAMGVLVAETAVGDERQRIYRSAYFLGRGDTGIATADDSEAIFYNPAGLAQGEGIYKQTVLVSPHVEFSKNSRDLYRQLSLEDKDEIEALKGQIGKPQHFGLYNLTALVFRRAAIGALVSNQTNLLVSKSVENGGLETLDANSTVNQALTFSLAERFFNKHLYLGVTTKYVNRGQGAIHANVIEAQDLKEVDKGDLFGYGNGWGADAGMMLKFGGQKAFQSEHSIGVTVENVGTTEFAAEKETTALDDLKQTVNIGFATTLGTKTSKFRLLADYRDVGGEVEENPLKRIHLGTELAVSGFVGVTGGLNQGYPTGGLFFDIYVVRLDAGFYTEEMGERVGSYPDQRYFVRISAGF